MREFQIKPGPQRPPSKPREAPEALLLFLLVIALLIALAPAFVSRIPAAGFLGPLEATHNVVR
jgi:hypothetical protein